MTRKYLFDVAFVATVGLAAIAGSIAIGAEAAKDTKAPAGGQAQVKIPEMKLPPGWTEEDMKACAVAGTPGKMQELLAGEAGQWHGKSTTWMSPGAPEAPPMTSEVTSSITPLMDGRYTRVEVNGDMPGMGPYQGLGVYGFDNVTQQFVCTWLDSHSTGMMNGVGKLASDGKSITWNFTYNCPITKKPALMRQKETVGGGNSKTLEMWGADPKSGKEFQMMKIEMTKK